MKKMKILLILLITTYSFGQTQNRDVVYLKNGSIIKGKITEMNPSKNLKIQTDDGSLFVYKMNEIEKMEKEDFVGKEMNNNNTSNGVSQKQVDQYFSNFLSKERPALKFIGTSKKNGKRREIYGQKIYEIEYELIMDVLDDIYVSTSQFMSAFSNNFNQDFSYTNSQTNGYEAALNGNKKKLSRGQRIVANGTMNFEDTDNGWRVTGYSNKNFKTVSNNYVTKEIAQKQTEEKVQQAAQLKANLDWKIDDISPVEYSDKYFTIQNVPIFNYGNLKYHIEPSSSYNGRNDVASSIQNVFYQAIESTNREVKSTEPKFSESKNKGEVIFVINKTDFNFTGTGFQCLITLTGYIKGEYNDPENLPFNYNIPITAKSNSYKKSMSKNQSFTSALEDLKTNVRGFIFQYEPIQLSLLKIETNKRGKVDYIVFKKPEKFINTKKMKFVVMELTDLRVQNNKFIMSGKVGDCVFKGKIIGDEIYCNVQGSKNKKAFENYINLNKNLIALSSY